MNLTVGLIATLVPLLYFAYCGTSSCWHLPRNKGPRKMKCMRNQAKPARTKPTRLTPEMRDKILTLIEAGCFCSTVAEAVGIHVNTLKLWRLRSKDEVDEQGNIVKRAQEPFRSFVLEFDKAAAIREIKLVQEVRKGGWKGAAWLLSRLYPDRWSQKRQIEAAKGVKIAPPTAATVVYMGGGENEPAPWTFVGDL